jgi:beta-lactamase class A
MTLTVALAASVGWAVHDRADVVDGHELAGASAAAQRVAPAARRSSTSTESITAAPASAAPASAAPTSGAAARADLDAVIAAHAGEAVSVAAVDTSTGASYSAGSSAGIWTASVYKLLVLEAVLWQHEQSGEPLDDGTADEAQTMIENSDNVAGYELFEAIGGDAGLASGASALGLRSVVPGVSDPAFTTIDAADGVRLLTNLVEPGPLDEASRSYALDLMSQVESDQRWGVSVVADTGTVFANKNGWLSVDDDNGPGEDDAGRWIVNSVGVVTVTGQQVLMAVLTEHNPDMDSGVDLVQSLAKDLAATVR